MPKASKAAKQSINKMFTAAAGIFISSANAQVHESVCFHTLPLIYKHGRSTCNTAHGSFIPFPAHAAKQVAVKNDAETNKASDELLESILAGDDDKLAPRAHRYSFSTSARQHYLV